MKRSPMTRKTPMRRTAMKRAAADHRYTRGLVEAIMAQNRPAKRSGKNAASAVVDLAAKCQGLPRISPARIAQRQEYHRLGPAYLEAHPYCQVEIFIRRLNEAQVIAHQGKYITRTGDIRFVPKAIELHHRNKANGSRLINFEYIMAAGAPAHDWIERHKNKAREMGLLCPINCKPDGTMPDGTKQPATPELLAQRHAEKAKS